MAKRKPAVTTKRRRQRLPPWKARRLAVLNAGPGFTKELGLPPPRAHPLDMVDKFLVVCQFCDGGTQREVNRDYAVNWLHQHITDHHVDDDRSVHVTLTVSP